MSSLGVVCIFTVVQFFGVCQAWPITETEQVLSPTSAAPAGARGTVTAEPSTVTLKVQGLMPGQYQIVAVQSTNRERVNLGFIHIADLDVIPSTEAGGNNRTTTGAHETEVLVATAQIHLPENLHLTSPVRVQVLDSGGEVLLHSPEQTQTTVGTAKP